jgi:acyl-CoA synthetase (AMP-forming)/AMP-acid ligase II
VSHIPEHYFSAQGLGNFTQALLRAHQETAQQVCLRLLFSHEQDLSLTYEELLQRSLHFTHALEKQGIESDEVVIIILPHGQDLVTSFFGSILHGAIPSIMPYLTEKLQANQSRLPAGSCYYQAKRSSLSDFGNKCGFASAWPVRAVSAEERTLKCRNPRLSSQDLKDLPTPIQHRALQHSSGTTGLQKLALTWLFSTKTKAIHRRLLDSG